jgi:hypothetical protein
MAHALAREMVSRGVLGLATRIPDSAKPVMTAIRTAWSLARAEAVAATTRAFRA